MTKPIISMIISFSDSKNCFTGIPRSLTRPSTMPKTIENTTNPRTFMLRDAISRPLGTRSDPGASFSRIVVQLIVPLLNIFMELFAGMDCASTVLLYSWYIGFTDLYLVRFCQRDKIGISCILHWVKYSNNTRKVNSTLESSRRVHFFFYVNIFIDNHIK